jgi:hypothetical protein
MDNSLRSLAPKEHDRVCELFKRHPCEYPQLKTHLQVVKIFKDVPKYLSLLEKVETFIIRQFGFNLIIKNIPDHAELRDTSKQTKVGHQEMRETLEQFGTVECLDLIRGVAYVKYDDPELCHNLINNMQMGPNIITTRLVC